MKNPTSLSLSFTFHFPALLVVAEHAQTVVFPSKTVSEVAGTLPTTQTIVTREF